MRAIKELELVKMHDGENTANGENKAYVKMHDFGGLNNEQTVEKAENDWDKISRLKQHFLQKL